MQYLVSIQYLRALAAGLVLIFHASLRTEYAFGTGAMGVDIFFVISGFVMYLTGRDLHPRDFMIHRVRRIVPLYWTITLFVYATTSEPIPVHELFYSLFFVAYVNSSAHLPVMPIVEVGWTLNLEMVFYLLFAVGLAMVRGGIVPVLVMFLTMIAVAGYLLTDLGLLANFYTRGIILEFAAGLLIGKGYVNGWLKLPPWMGVVLVSLAILFLFHLSGISHRAIRWGIPAAILTLGCLALEPVIARHRAGGLVLLGDASYSLYLTHQLVISAALPFFAALGLAHEALLFLALVPICVALALLVYLYLEKPINRTLRSMSQGSSGSVRDRC